ncbi:hypothetical protein TEA_022571 [Camellia sinensis var. sinensis]|uniref:Uncharacterized protein n=1 Tax=Camellia sinensis var. sinensis TaxID=542762 RepID=A0A4V3WPG4_CAMSN|nr:hypothetical protein TEA_022571 [Camellia sinensis var. sinensis]
MRVEIGAATSVRAKEPTKSPGRLLDPNDRTFITRTLICAVNQDAEESFKKTVEVDRLIDTLRDANANELQKLVVENVLAFNESFWIRLAARTDTCKSEDDKARIFSLQEKIESATDVLKEILKPVVDDVEEIPWPPRDPEALKLMEKAKEDEDKPGLQAMLQKVLQLYASRVLSKRSYAKKGTVLEVLQSWAGGRVGRRYRKASLLAGHCLIWLIWLEHNRRTFQGVSLSVLWLERWLLIVLHHLFVFFASA